MKFFTNLKFLLGLSDLQIQQIAEHCNELFSVSDINLYCGGDMGYAACI